MSPNGASSMEAIAQLNSALDGRYAIEREIGAGGMATVYLARDLKHDRHVALKVLKPELGAVLGVERFLAEIRTTASLQHPNLLPLFDSGEARGEWSDGPGLLFYVMPYVDGESLRARLDREKQLPVAEALRIAIAVADALCYAHEQGVIHRDLKPENILIQAGQPVLADFGIALAVANAGGTRITQTGLSLGTPQYMSPEQATGDRAIDGRTDIYSLGAVLYEMLTGDPPHTGSTAQAIIARVLTERPRSARLSRDSVPGFVDAAIDRALAKLPADRFSNAREFAAALAGASAAPWAYTAAHATKSRRRSGIAAAAAAAALSALAASGWLRPLPGTKVERARFALTFPDSARTREEISGENIAISPNGSQIVYVGGPGQGQLFVRPINELDSRPLRGTDGAQGPRFSPDGKWVAFVVGNTLKKISLAGGAPIHVADTVNRASWGDNGEIVIERGFTSRTSGLWRVSASGSAPVNFTTVDFARHESAHTWPFVLPGSEAALLTIERGGPGSSELAVVRFNDGKVVPLTLNGVKLKGVSPRYLSSGHLLFGQFDGTLMAARFDLKQLRVVGEPVTVLDSLIVKGGGATEAAVSSNGTLVFAEGDNRRQIVLVDHAGVVRPLVSAPQRYEYPRLSPVGDRLAVQITETGRSSADIWVYSLPLRTWTRVTRDGRSQAPVWTADGRRVAWTFGDDANAEVRWQRSDGSGQAEALFAPTQRIEGATFSPDGRLVAGLQVNSGMGDVVVSALDSASSVRTPIKIATNAYAPQFSPDGHWVAYQAGDSGPFEVFVSAASGAGGRLQISTDGGSEPVWAPDGHTLYYRTRSRLMAASITTSPVLGVTRRDSLFSDSFQIGFITQGYDISRDGKSFLMVGAGNQRERLVVVFGWLDELRERIALATSR